MSTLGKVLTLVVVVLAIAIGVLEAHRYASSRNWREAYNLELKNRKDADEQRGDALKRLADYKKDAETAAQNYQTKIGALERSAEGLKEQLDRASTDLEERKRQIEGIKETLSGLQKDFGQLMDEKNTWKKDRDNALKEADDLRQMNQRLDDRLREVDTARKTLYEQLLTAEEKIKELEKKLRGKGAGEGVEPVVTAPQLIRGLITDVDNAEKTAQINVGTDDGVVEGMEFIIYRGNQYLAVLTITKVANNSSAGRLSITTDDVRRNDNVTNELNP